MLIDDPLIKAVFLKAGVRGHCPLYLVGGYLRDYLRGRRPKRPYDLDFVVKGDVKALAKAVSSGLGGTLVELKAGMLRVVLEDGTTIDFSQIKTDISEDLARRDFTMNAMAWSSETGLIDPNCGLRDIKRGLIRGILKQNFKDDPLRLLRAYRFSAELGFDIDTGTRQIVREMSGLIRQSASERITLEFLKLLSSKTPLKALRAALNDGLLVRILPLSFNDLRANINLISRLERNLKEVSKVSWAKGQMKAMFPQGLTYPGLLRLEGLLLGKGPKRSLLRLAVSINKRTETVNRLLDSGKEPLWDVFEKAGDSLLDLLILTGKPAAFYRQAGRFLRIKRRGQLSSEEVMAHTGLGEGPELGRLISLLKRLEFEKTIRTRKQALKYIMGLT